jgi:gliding motility-associated protein GldL
MYTFENAIMPKIYGLGAAVVIVGALFKIMHWPFAGPMLVVGLGTEALIFAFSAFMPLHKDPEWSKVYPQLAEDYLEEGSEEATEASVTKKLDVMLEESGINQDVLTW